MREETLSIITKQAGLSFTGKMISRVFQSIGIILLANLLGPILLGIYQLGVRIHRLLLNFTKLGLDIGLAKYIPVSLRQDKRVAKALLLYVLRIGILCSIPFGISLFLLSKYIAIDIFNKPNLIGVLQIFSFLLLISTINSLIISANRGAKQLKYNIFLSHFLHPIIFCFILIVAYLIGWTFHKLLISFVILNVCITILLFLSIKKTLYFTISIKDIIEKFDSQLGVSKKELFSFSTPLLFQGLILFLMGSVDILMLGYFCSADVVGIYSIALRIAILISFILYSFNDILLPVISEKFIERDFAEIKYLYQTITKWIFSLSLLFCGLIYTLHNDILLLFGKEYLPATIPLLILCIGQLVNSSVGGVGILLEVMGHQKLVLLNALILLTLNIILNYIFIANLNLNMMGAALATSISIILSNVVRLLELKILRNMQPFNLKYLKVIISFIPAFLITNVLLNMIDTWFVWRILSGVIIFTSTNALIYYFLGITEEDRFIFEKVKGKLWTEKI